MSEISWRVVTLVIQTLLSIIGTIIVVQQRSLIARVKAVEAAQNQLQVSIATISTERRVREMADVERRDELDRRFDEVDRRLVEHGNRITELVRTRRIAPRGGD